MVKKTSVVGGNGPRVLVVGAWLDELQPHVSALREAGFSVAAHMPPGDEEPRIDLTRLDIAVVDLRGHSPARDALNVVKDLMQSADYPIVLINTVQAERAVAQLDQLSRWLGQSRNVRRFPERWVRISESPPVLSSQTTSPAELVDIVRSLVKRAKPQNMAEDVPQ